MRLAALLLLGGVCACGGPILQNVPRANPAAVAGIAAAVAGAATIADPQGAARKQDEKNRADVGPQAKRVDEQMPSDVFDRLQDAERDRP